MEIQEFRIARNKYSVIYTKFSLEQSKHRDCLFCFYEGEDSKYYNSRIMQYTGYDYQDIVSYNCHGRKDVLRVRDMIEKENAYDEVNKVFFIDRDYLPYETISENVYQTPCYSIENFYTSTECFSRMLCVEFGLNVIEDDHRKCVNDYALRQKEFHRETLLLNAWLSCQRKLEKELGRSGVKLSNFKIKKLFNKIEIDCIEVKQPIDKEIVESEFPDHLEVEDERLNAEIAYFNENDEQQLFRGKFELKFMCLMIESLRNKKSDCTYFSDKLVSVCIDPNCNTLSELSKYADTPVDLIHFLENHKKYMNLDKRKRLLRANGV